MAHRIYKGSILDLDHHVSLIAISGEYSDVPWRHKEFAWLDNGAIPGTYLVRQAYKGGRAFETRFHFSDEETAMLFKLKFG